MLGERAEVAFLDYTQVPFFNQDMEFPVPLPVAQVREAVSRADGVWLFVPEYNHSLPGVLKTCWIGSPVPISLGKQPASLANQSPFPGLAELRVPPASRTI